MLIFTLSEHVDIERFHNSYRSSTIWSEAGFKDVPSLTTTWQRLTELEPHHQAFIDAANAFIKIAVNAEPRIVQDIWVDGTGFEVHSRLEHCCTDRAACLEAGGTPAKFPPKAHPDEIVQERAEGAEEPPPNADDGDDSDETEDEVNGRFHYLTIKGHRFRTLDPSAGARTINKKQGTASKSWIGGYIQPAKSIFMNAPLAINVFSASDAEFDHFPDLLWKVIEATGDVPRAVVADRHYAVKDLFEMNTRLGIATITPWRRWKKDQQRSDLDNDLLDRHGIPRCQYCGGPGDREVAGGFYLDENENPRIRFFCQTMALPDCAKSQSISCAKNWALLGPISRRTELYHSLKSAGRSSEQIFRHWEARYRLGGFGVDNRSKRLGIEWVRLRASAALALEWFRICLRHGWIGNHPCRNDGPTKTLRKETAPDSLESSRHASGLNRPYGAAAHRAGLAQTADPPGKGT
jgi:hypothetical protein